MTTFPSCVSWTGCPAILACLHYRNEGLSNRPCVTALCRACSGAAERIEQRAVRGEGSQHDLPSRTAEADAAIGHAETLCCAEVAPLGGGIRGDTSEGET